MKRVIVLFILALTLIGIQFIANCADPLETTANGSGSPVGPKTDTIYSFDTVVVIKIDSIIHFDTIRSYDTVVVIRIDSVLHYDTIRSYDTTVVIRIDSVLIYDTIHSFDTIAIFDTVMHIDTVFINGHDTCEGSKMVCSRIASNQQEIIWMFRNLEGIYHLEFSATTERSHPTQTLNLNIDGHDFAWSTADNPEFITDLHLGPNAKIVITSNKPGAFGHAIDVCLTMTAR